MKEWIINGIPYKKLRDDLSQLSETERQVNNRLIRKDILLSKNGDVEPNKIIAQFICEFGIRNGYSSKIQHIEGKTEDAYISTLAYPYTKSQDYHLEIDHIYPLEKAKTISESCTYFLREDPSNIYNSPMNMAYLTSKENKFIRDRNYDQFKGFLSSEYKDRNKILNYDTYSETIEKRYEELFNHLYSEIKIYLDL